jgi:hypothetical protein
MPLSKRGAVHLGGRQEPCCDDSGSVELKATAASGEVLLREQVCLFDEDREGLDLFVGTDESGECFRRCRDIWTEKLPMRRPVVLRATGEYDVAGCPSSHFFELDGARWWRVLPPEFEQLKVLLDGALYWNFPNDGLPRARFEQPLEVRLATRTWAPGENVVWDCDLAAGWGIVGARLGSRVLAIENTRGGVQVALGKVEILPPSFQMRLLLRSRDGRSTRYALLKPPMPKVNGLLLRTPNGWQRLQVKGLSDVATASFIFLDGRSNDEDAAFLFEGGWPACRLSRTKPVRISHYVEGIGAPLFVRQRRFNYDRDPLHTTKPLLDQGRIQALASDGTCLRLQVEGGWRPTYTVEALTKGGAILAKADVLCDGDLMLLDGDIAGVALLQGDELLGRAARPDAVAEALRAASSEPAKYASSIAWLFRQRMPVELEPIRVALENTARSCPLGALIATLHEEMTANEALCGAWRAKLHAAHSDLCRFLRSREAGEPGAGRLLNQEVERLVWHEGDDLHMVTSVFSRLGRVEPILAGVFLRSALDAPDCLATRPDEQRAAFRAMQRWACAQPQRPDERVLAQRLDVNEQLVRESLRNATEWALRDVQVLGPQVEHIRQLLDFKEFRDEVRRRVLRLALEREPCWIA